MKSEKRVPIIVKILLLVFVGVFSVMILAPKSLDMKPVNYSVESLGDKSDTIMKFAGTCIATSLAITMLPDDIATPLASEFAEMNRYFIVILAAIFIEKLIVTVGVKFTFMCIIPAACVLLIIAMLRNKEALKSFAKKLFIFSAALIMVVPISLWTADVIGADYMNYVDETISEADAGSEKINDVMNDESEKDKSVLDKLSEAFKTAIRGMTDMLTYFNNILKKCVNSVAILLVTNLVVPILIMLIFVWLLKQLFNINVPTAKIVSFVKTGKYNKTEATENLNATAITEIPETTEIVTTE